MKKNKIRRVFTPIALICLFFIGCGIITRISQKRPIYDSRLSVFQSYSGKQCQIKSLDGTKSQNVNCENLMNFVDPTHDMCQGSGPFIPKQGYFPKEDKVITLCTSRDKPERQSQDLIRFLVFGDFGVGQLSFLDARQKTVAKAMYNVCPPKDSKTSKEKKTCDFALMTGDLIHPDGVRNVFDVQFKTKFEEVYDQFGAFDFYGVMGNHDHHLNYLAQLEYTFFSDKWRMPHTNYAVPWLPPWLNIYGLDTTILLGQVSVEDSEEDQLQNVREYLCQKDGWKMVFGHHPPHSSGYHGGTMEMRTPLDKLAEDCPFHIYFAGHDHHQEHIRSEFYDVVIQGAGGIHVREVREVLEGEASYEQRFALAGHGFAVVEATQTAIEMRFYDIDKFNFENGEFTKPPNYEDYVYHCQWQLNNDSETKNLKSGCLPID